MQVKSKLDQRRKKAAYNIEAMYSCYDENTKAVLVRAGKRKVSDYVLDLADKYGIDYETSFAMSLLYDLENLENEFSLR